MNLRLRHIFIWHIFICCAAAWGGPGVVLADIIQTNAASPSEIGFLASTVDLINSGASSLLSTTHTGYAPFSYAGSGPTSTANLNDGSAGLPYIGTGYSSLNTVGFDADGKWTSTYRLNTSVNTNGYDVTAIRTMSGWAAPRRDQQFEMQFATVAKPETFTSYGTYSYVPGGHGSARITLTDSGGAIAQNVSAVRFSVQQAGGVPTVYREFDVFGGPTGSGRPPAFQQLAPNDSRISYSDYARVVTLDAKEARFDRVIAGAQGSLQNANPGARVRFRTDATTITASFTTGSLGITEGTGLILIDGAQAGTFNASTSKSSVEVDVPVSGAGYHDVDLLLPYSQDVRFTGLLVNDGAGFQPTSARPAMRYVAYGDSITEGFWASDSSRNYSSLVAEQKGWEVVNMGFGWRGMKDSGTGGADGAAIATLGADVISVMMGYNDASARLSAPNYRAFMEAFIARIREVDISVPVYLISPLFTSNARNQTLLLQYRDQILDLVDDSSDQHLHWIDGLALGINAGNVGTFMSDGIHPNDAGFALVAANLAQLMENPDPRMGGLSLQTGGLTLQMGDLGLRMQVVPEPGAVSLAAAAAIIVLLRMPRRRTSAPLPRSRAGRGRGLFAGWPVALGPQ